MTRRIALSFAFLVLALPAFAANELTGKTLIDGDTVTVGDLFTNTAGNAGYVLAPAPEVGKKLTLSANDLVRVARAFKLDWKPQDNHYLVLERNASLIDNGMIINALKGSDLRDKIADKAEFRLNNLSEGIFVQGKEPVDLIISNTAFDLASEKFTASLQIKRGDNVLKEVSLEGLAAEMVRVPVLKFAMTSNSAITAKDIIEVTMPRQELRGDVILDKNELTGMIAKRSMQANTTVSKADVIPPVMVKRNDLVTIVYKSGAIQLSSKARSMGVGSRGDSLMFLNMNSKKTFEAKVTGPQMAEVNLDG